MSHGTMWLAFGALVIAVLAIDLGLFNRKAHTPSFKEAAAWSVVWVGLAALFGLWVFLRDGVELGMQFTVAYLIEKSLSVDNVFVFAVMFRHFGVAPQFQHRLLFWGVIGAVAMRAVMIAAGTALINRFHWVVIVFGLFLIWTGIPMFLHRNREMDVTEVAVLRWLRRHVRISETYDGQKFFTRKDGLLYATPLAVVLVLVELTDLMFAVDSIPAVLAISRDFFIVLTSNVFAILGLRAFYFLLAGVIEMFEYLTVGLAAVLVFVGFKMLGIWHIPTAWSLGVIVVILGSAISASIMKARKRVMAS